MRARISIVAPIVIILVLAALAAILYLFIYKKRVNRALVKGEGADSAGPEPSSVSRSALIIALIIVMAITLIRIADLNSSVKSLSSVISNQSNQISQLQFQISQMQQAIAAQDSMLTDYSFEFGSYDAASHSAKIIFTATPKEAADDTEMTLSAAGCTVKLEKDGARAQFKGEITADIFGQTTELPEITIKTDGISRTEKLEYYELGDLWLHYLPKIMVAGGGSTEEDGSKIDVDWEIQLDFYSKNDSTFFSKEGIVLKIQAGDSVKEEDISGKVTWNGSWGRFHTDLKEKYKLEEGQTFRITVSAKDSLGYTHEVTILEVPAKLGGTEDYVLLDASGKKLN